MRLNKSPEVSEKIILFENVRQAGNLNATPEATARCTKSFRSAGSAKSCAAGFGAEPRREYEGSALISERTDGVAICTIMRSCMEGRVRSIVPTHPGDIRPSTIRIQSTQHSNVCYPTLLATGRVQGCFLLRSDVSFLLHAMSSERMEKHGQEIQ
jgi:hypothetical protein